LTARRHRGVSSREGSAAGRIVLSQPGVCGNTLIRTVSITLAATYIPVTLTSFNHPEQIEEPYTISSDTFTITDPAVLSKDCPPYTGRTVSNLPEESDETGTSSSSDAEITKQPSTSAAIASQTAGGEGHNSSLTSSSSLDQEKASMTTLAFLVLFCIFLAIM
jgi:hypothetical protein